MTHVFELETTIKQMIDEMKGLIVTVGLTGSPKEIVLITSAFLYKFLNDRFVVNLRQFSKEIGQPAQDIIADADLMDAFYDEYSQDVEFKYEDTIDYLVRFTTQDKFYKKNDSALKTMKGNENRCLPGFVKMSMQVIGIPLQRIFLRFL